MAADYNVSPRTLSRWLNELRIAWPPIDRQLWTQIAREATVHVARADFWLITCRVTAATLSDAEAKLHEEGVFIIEAKRLEPVSTWPVRTSDRS